MLPADDNISQAMKPGWVSVSSIKLVPPSIHLCGISYTEGFDQTASGKEDGSRNTEMEDTETAGVMGHRNWVREW